MRGTTPTLHCDGDDGFCGIWDVDFYEATASAVGGVQITTEQRAPGWHCTDLDDLCPEHARLLREALEAGDAGHEGCGGA